MTILQLKYAIVIANSSSMREAASKLFVTQAALSSTVKELEQELGITIFQRTNKGVLLTDEGIEFVEYCKRAVSQYRLIEDRYIDKDKNKNSFSVSMLHYVFAVQAFVNTVKLFDADSYIYSVYETGTSQVFDNVRNQKSEIGIISYNKRNEKVVKKLLREYKLTFEPLMTRDTYAYVCKDHPLAGRKEISLADLKKYPCIAFEQNSDNEYYLSEEALDNYNFNNVIKSNDRATSVELLISLDGFSIGTGIMSNSVAISKDIVCIKLKEEDPLTIGYIVKSNHKLSEIGEKYIEEIKKYKEH